MSELTPTPRTRVKRLPQRGSYDREVLNAILDEGFLCHVAFLYEGQARVIPTIYARGGDFLYLHGARANRMLNSMIEPGHDAWVLGDEPVVIVDFGEEVEEYAKPPAS